MTTSVKYYMFNRFTHVPFAHGEPIAATELPMPGFHILAGNFFTHASWIKNVGLIPESYFDSEEVLMTVMSYAAGYRIYHHSEVRCYHYNETGEWPSKQDIDPVHDMSVIQARKDGAIKYWKKYLENVREDVLSRFKTEYGVDFINLIIEDRARNFLFDGPDHLKTEHDLEFYKRKEMMNVVVPPSEITVELKKPSKSKKKMQVVVINNKESIEESSDEAD